MPYEDDRAKQLRQDFENKIFDPKNVRTAFEDALHQASSLLDFVGQSVAAHVADLKLRLASKDAELAELQKRLHKAEARVEGLMKGREKWMREAKEAKAQIPKLMGCQSFALVDSSAVTIPPLVVPAAWKLSWENEPEGTKRADWLVAPNLGFARMAARVWPDGKWVIYGEEGAHLLSGAQRAVDVSSDGWAAMLRVEEILNTEWCGSVDRSFG